MQPRFQFRPVASEIERSHLDRLQNTVLGDEPSCRTPVPLLGLSGPGLSILAYADGRRLPVGCLTVVDTSEDALSRLLYEIPDNAGSTAFYGNVAVLSEYRGFSIPVRLIFEAQRLFVRPRRIESTWLLYPQHRIASARLCRILQYKPVADITQVPASQACVLLRKEPANCGYDPRLSSLPERKISVYHASSN